MRTLTLESVLACPHLPSLPSVAMRVLELSRDESSGVDAIARVVQNDPALSAKILRTVNSSYYALPSPCSTISRALTYMGLATVKSLVLGFSLRAVTEADNGFDFSEYWRRCLHSAACARRLASSIGACDPDEAFAAALMQDIGMLAMQAVASDAYSRVVAQTQGDHRRLPEVEQRELGFAHTEAGAALGSRWHLPEGMIECIRHHHDGEGEKYREMVRVVCLGTEAAVVVSLPNPGPAVTRLRERAAEWFGLSEAQVDEFVREMAAQVAELSDLFGIKANESIDVNWVLGQAEEASVVNQLAMEREAESLRRIAVTDALTGAANRKRFDEELSARFDQARAFQGSLGLLIGDIDRFKSVNDVHGHRAGDAVIVEVAARLKRSVRGADLVCRYGGEEFGVILPGAPIKEVATIAERLRIAIAEQPVPLGQASDKASELSITISIGAAVFDPESSSVLTTSERLVTAADRAMYVAKQSGRNCVRVFRTEKRKAVA